jgi:predicted nucleic acid-binding protein
LPICLDASVAVKLITWEEHSRLARRLFDQALDSADVVVAPDLLSYEIASALWQKVRRGAVDAPTGNDAMLVFRALPIQYLSAEDLALPAWDAARTLAIPSMYDAHYLAASQLTGAPLWTADRRLANTAADWSGELRLLGRDAPDHV